MNELSRLKYHSFWMSVLHTAFQMRGWYSTTQFMQNKESMDNEGNIARYCDHFPKRTSLPKTISWTNIMIGVWANILNKNQTHMNTSRGNFIIVKNTKRNCLVWVEFVVNHHLLNKSLFWNFALCSRSLKASRSILIVTSRVLLTVLCISVAWKGPDE